MVVADFVGLLIFYDFIFSARIYLYLISPNFVHFCTQNIHFSFYIVRGYLFMYVLCIGYLSLPFEYI